MGVKATSPIRASSSRNISGAPLLNGAGLVIIRQLIERLGIAQAINAGLRLLSAPKDGRRKRSDDDRRCTSVRLRKNRLHGATGRSPSPPNRPIIAVPVYRHVHASGPPAATRRTVRVVCAGSWCDPYGWPATRAAGATCPSPGRASSPPQRAPHGSPPLPRAGLPDAEKRPDGGRQRLRPPPAATCSVLSQEGRSCRAHPCRQLALGGVESSAQRYVEPHGAPRVKLADRIDSPRAAIVIKDRDCGWHRELGYYWRIPLKLETTYTRTRFSEEAIRNTLAKFDEVFKAPHSLEAWNPLLSVTKDNQTWKFDKEDEFFTDYSGCDVAFFSREIGEGTRSSASFQMQLIHNNNTTIVSVETDQDCLNAGKRGSILSVFRVLAKYEDDCRLPGETIEPVVFIGHGAEPCVA